MSLSPEELLAEYRIAFRNANPNATMPTVDYSHGWFRFSDYGGRNYRRQYFVGMLETLRDRANERSASVALASEEL